MADGVTGNARLNEATWFVFPQSETKTPLSSLYRAKVAAHRKVRSASKTGEVAVLRLWPQWWSCGKVFLFNVQERPARIESEYATFQMGLCFG